MTKSLPPWPEWVDIEWKIILLDEILRDFGGSEFDLWYQSVMPHWLHA